jgi:hypothetical protein
MAPDTGRGSTARSWSSASQRSSSAEGRAALLRSMAVARRDLAHPLVPTLAAAVLGAAYLLAAPDLTTPDWSIWEVHDPEPPISGAARLTAAGAEGFDLEASRPGPVLVRQHATPYWTVADGDGCVSEDEASGWTLVDVRRPGVLRVRARFTARGALRREPRCAVAPGAPVARECGQPPCWQALSPG